MHLGLVCHSRATTTHSQSDEPALAAAGITQSTIRLSVGIEHIDDIIADPKGRAEELCSALHPPATTAPPR